MQSMPLWAALGLALFLATLPAAAHHSFSMEFDINKPVTLRGVVTKVDWINPHAWVHIDVKGDNGQVAKWEIELGTPNTLFRRGVTKTSLAAGTEVVVNGYLARNGAKRANGTTVTLSNGENLSLGGLSEAEAPGR